MFQQDHKALFNKIMKQIKKIRIRMLEHSILTSQKILQKPAFPKNSNFV